MGWDEHSGQPALLHFKELSWEPTIADVQTYIEEETARIDHLWEYVTVEVRVFYNVENFKFNTSI